MIKYLILLILVLFLLDYVLKNKLLKNIKYYFNLILKKLGLSNKNSINDNDKNNKKNNKETNNDLNKVVNNYIKR